jgi:choline dehydrogenase-like flavoprotein
MRPKTLEASVLVIGSGPGGACSAALLAEAGWDVLLIEEGEDLPLDSAPSYSFEEMRQKYRGGGLTTTLGKTNITYVEGRCVGGGSEVNSGLYHRPLASRVNAWARDFQIEDFSMARLEPFFDQVEKDQHISTWPQGVGPASKMLRKGAQNMGWSSQEIPRFFKYEKHKGAYVGKKQSMRETLIPRFRAAGGRLLSNTRVHSLEMDGRRATEAKARQSDKNGIQKIRIRFKHLIVACGAIQTPLLLQKSGITQCIGDTLQLHPMVRFAARFDEDINDLSYGVPTEQIDEFKPAMTLGCSYSSKPHLALWMGPSVPNRMEKLNDWKKMAVFYVAVLGAGKGTIRPIPLIDEPLVRFPVLPKDLGRLGRGVQRLGRLLLSAGAQEMYSPVDGAPLNTVEALDQLGLGLPSTGPAVSTIHLFSSCPMGEADACPADSWGKLKQTSNVWINDASLMPTSPGVNPQGTLLAMAHRNLQHFLQEENS